MTEEQPSPIDRASQLQEAIDSLVQTFDYRDALNRIYIYGTTKRTVFEIRTEECEISYELHYNGYDEGTEPRLIRRS